MVWRSEMSKLVRVNANISPNISVMIGIPLRLIPPWPPSSWNTEPRHESKQSSHTNLIVRRAYISNLSTLINLALSNNLQSFVRRAVSNHIKTENSWIIVACLCLCNHKTIAQRVDGVCSVGAWPGQRPIQSSLTHSMCLLRLAV